MKNLIFISFILLCISCKKDNSSSNCLSNSAKTTKYDVVILDSLLPHNSPYGYQLYTNRPYSFWSGTFNPNSINQIAYVKTENSSLKETVCIFDFCTNKEITLPATNVEGYTTWGGDWITYIALDQTLWRVKTDGSVNTKISNVGDVGASISPNGNRIVYQNYSAAREYITDINGNMVDSILESDIYHNSTFTCWQSDSVIFFCSGSCCPRLRKYNLHTRQLTYITSLNSYSGPQGVGLVLPGPIQVSADGLSIYYTDELHLYRLSIPSLTFDTLVKGGASPFFTRLSLFSDRYILFDETLSAQLSTSRPDSLLRDGIWGLYNLTDGTLKKIDFE